MIKKMILLVVAILLMGASMTGCSVLEKGIDEYSKDKEECVLNTDNVTQFTYKGDSFTILDDTLSNSELGEWVGYIRKLAVIDSNGKILLQQDTEKATFKTLADIADSKPDAAYIIPFLNVYTVKDGNTQELIVDVNGGYHKAIFKTDKLLLERAIMNVISNAVDYSPPLGTIYVTTQKVDHFLHISITDEGTGFTSEAIHHAQEQFFMGDKSRTSNMHFGMGLYITNSIIKQHDGQLILSNSKKTGGAQVIIKIPY